VRTVAAEEPVEEERIEPEAEPATTPRTQPATEAPAPASQPMTLSEAISSSTFMVPGQPMTMYGGPYGACGPEGCPPMMGYCPTFGIFLDSLFLRPGNSEVVYSLEKTGCDPELSAPTGLVGSILPKTSYGFHTGINYSRRPGRTVELAYTWYETTTSHNIEAAFGRVLDSQVTHPSQPSCGENSLSASADDAIRFQFLDLDFKRAVIHDCNRDVYVLAGLRYADLEESFSSSQNTGSATGLSTVGTNINFKAPGLRLGVGGEGTGMRSGWLVYGRGALNLLAGEMTTSYRQVNQFGGAVPIALSNRDYRLVPLLESEVGLGWRSPAKRWRLSAGYQLNAWFNTMTTADYISGVRSGRTEAISSTQTFDGFVATIEFRR
jgi:hypothetical protein